MHFGNAADSPGGIASVIRRHLARSIRTIESRQVTTYDPRHSRLARSRTYLAAIRATFGLQRGTVVHIHLSQRGSLIREGSLVWFARLRRLPVVVTLHGSSLSGANRWVRTCVRLVTRPANAVHGFAESYRSQFGIGDDRWITRPNDVALPADISPVVDRPKQVVYAGEVGRRKGFDLLAAAWARRSPDDWTLLVAGGLAADFGPPPSHENLVILGEIPHDSVLSLLADSQVLIQPSRAEAFPMTVCEALAAGCAVVGTRVGGLGELLDNADQVTIAATVEDVQRGLDQLLFDEQLRAELSHRARAYAAAELSTTTVDRAWERTYQALGGYGKTAA